MSSAGNTNFKPLAVSVGVAAVSSPLEVGADRAPQAAGELAAVLRESGCDVVELGAIQTPDQSVAAGRKLAEHHVHALALASTSWFEDYLVVDLLEECRVPVLLWALPGMETGGLCGMQQLTFYLNGLSAAYQCVYGPIAAGQNLIAGMAFLRAAALKAKLRRARIGLAGHRVAGMTDAAVNEVALKRSLGPRIVPLDMPTLLADADAMPNDHAETIWRDVVKSSGACKVHESEGMDSMKVYLAVKEQVQQHGLDALTSGCYPHLMGRVCLAASLLADEGVPLGCEGDINGAVGQLALTLLTGKPTHNTDWLDPLEDGTVVFTHCGSGSFSLAENRKDITLGSVRLMGQGVCALFPARPGPVTLMNLIPVGGGYQCAVLEGEAISTEMVFPGNPLRVRFRRPTNDLLAWIHAKGIGHHWMAGYGHVADEIRAWCQIAGGGVALVEPQ